MEDLKPKSDSFIIERGVRLTVHGGDCKREQQFALACQWIDFKNQSIRLDRPEPLLCADESPAFRHIALRMLRPDDDITDSVIQLQNCNAKGVLLVHTSDHLPVEQLNARPCGDIKIPVMLIARRLGEGLLRELKECSHTVKLTIVHDSSVQYDVSVPEYQPPDVRKANQMAFVDETRKISVAGKKFGFTKRMRKLLFASDGQPVVMCTDLETVGNNTFLLLDEYERHTREHSVSRSKLKTKLRKICSQLTKCMDKNYQQDLPYHCIMVFRLQSQSTYHDIDSVLSYKESCEKRLRNLSSHSIETVFVPFARSTLLLPFGGSLVPAHRLLYLFLLEVHRSRWSYHQQDKSLASNSVESFGISLTAAEMVMVLQQDEMKPTVTWKSLISKLDANWFGWSQELLNEMKQQLDLAPFMGLQPNNQFDFHALIQLIQQYHLVSFEQIRQTIVTLYPSIPVDGSSQLDPVALVRCYVLSIVHVGAEPCESLASYSNAGDLQSFVEEARELIVTLCNIHEHISNTGKTNSIESSMKSDVTLFESEIAKWTSLILAWSPFLSIHHPEWAQQVLTFRKGIPTSLLQIIHKTVIKLINESLQQLSPHSIYKILEKLLFIPKEVVEKFLRTYQPQHAEMLTHDVVWQNLFTLVISRFDDWKPLKSSILVLLESVAQKARNRLHFFKDVLRLAQPQRCPDILSSEGSELLHDLKEFLINYLKNAKGYLQVQLGSVLDLLDSDGQSQLRDTLLDVFCEVILPNQDEFLEQQTDAVKQFLSDLSSELKTLGEKMSKNTLPNNGIRSLTCWRLLVHCCQCASPSQLTLTNPPRWKALANVLKFFHTYWPLSSSETSVVSIQTSTEALLTKDMQEYGSWYFAVREWLYGIHHRVVNGEITLGELNDFEQNYYRVKELYDSFLYSSFLIAVDDINGMVKEFENVAMTLTPYLLYETASHKWKKTQDLLVFWGVKIDKELFQLVEKSLDFTQVYSEKTVGSMNACLLSFKPSVRYKDIKAIHDKVSLWLVPIIGDKNMLYYFSAHESVLFQVYLEEQLTDHLQHSQVQSEVAGQTLAISRNSVMVSSIFGLGSDITDADDEDQSMSNTRSLHTFAEGLQKTRSCLTRLLNQTARFQDVSVIGQERFRGVDVDREFATLVEYSEFRDLSVSKSVHSGISDMLSLIQYAGVIQTVISVCEQYNMRNCLSDQKFIRLKEFGAKLQNSSQMDELTIAESSEEKKKLDMLFMDTPVSRLHVFDAVQQSEEFFTFICDNKFYTHTGRISFSEQVGLITNQLKDQEYDETVLSHLQVAFQCVVPFTDPNVTFSDLLQTLKQSDVFKLLNWMHPMHTVNTNIATIKMWFSKAEGDTLENVTRDLEAMMTSGLYDFHLGVKVRDGILETFLLTSQASDECDLELVYTRQSESVLEAQTLSDQALSSNAIDVMRSLPHHFCVARKLAGGEEPTLSEKVKGIEQLRMEAISHSKQGSRGRIRTSVTLKAEVRLHGEELDDFVRKLGFMQGEGNDQQQVQMRKFLKKKELVQDMFDVCSQLHRLGEPNYRDKQLQHGVATSLEDTKDQLKMYQADLKTWQQHVSDLQKKYEQLLFFNIRQILALAKALTSRDFLEVANFVSPLFTNSQDFVKVLQSKIPQYCQQIKDAFATVSPFQLCGEFLTALVADDAIMTYLVPKPKSYIKNSEPVGHTVGHTIHKAYSFGPDQILRLLFQIYQGPPESFEVLRCTANTTAEDISLFLQRAAKFAHRAFVMVHVNHLRTNLQEQVLRFQLDPTSQSVQMHYILDWHSICHDAPWINVKHYKESKLKLSESAVLQLCQERVLQPLGMNRIDVVFGRPGDGKSHYIKKQMKLCKGDTCIIAVHEAFSVQKAIQMLQSMKPQVHPQGNCVYFNITISPPRSTDSKEAEQYCHIMNEFHWFLFDLVGMSFVQDSATGQSFRLKAGYNWQFYVEVPSVADEQDAGKGLMNFLALVPFLKYVGRQHHVKQDDPLDITDDMQLVCKYLKALKNPKHINRLYRRNRQVKFSTDPDLDYQTCHQLLQEAMEDHVRKNKIMQELFVKYMKRRCKVLENLPGFNFNQGEGFAVDKKTGKQKRCDTKQLGSTLLSTMLREVNSFCHPDIQEDWKLHSHQQLVYDVKNESGSILFLSINPDKLDSDEREKLEKVGIEIPSVRDLKSRQLLDEYLARALNVDQEAYQVPPKGQSKYGLAQIDEAKYVLTVDYAVKMLNIHERRMCGVPVVIEGETGVGKTALLQMLSRLWNKSLMRSRRIALDSIAEILQMRAGAVHAADDFEVRWDSEDVKAAIHVASCINTGTTPDREFVNKVCSISWEDIRKVLLDAVVDPSMSLFDIDKTVITNAKDHNASLHTARLLEAFLSAHVMNTFHKLNVHAALTPKDFHQFFTPIFKQAEELQKLTMERSGEQPPTVVVFLDEINTSSCMGVIKELLVDRSVDGGLVPANVFLVAACNPHRGSSAVICKSSKRDDWVLGSYYVRPLPPTLRFLVWDYGALDESQEHDYIQEKITMNRGELSLQVLQHTDLIAKCQSITRGFAVEQLQHVEFTSKEAVTRAKSSVSQRDIQRVFTLTAYFENFLRDYFQSKSSEWRGRTAILASLGIVYYLRLDEKYREKFVSHLKKLEISTSVHDFSSVFESVMNKYVNEMYIPYGIAKTRALKENLFATIVCTACGLPLIIVGPPGCSKTLSFNLALVNMKGAESRQSFFRNTKHFPALDSYHYQCSRRSTSLEIENVFKRAIKRQKNHNMSQLPIKCVVFMDEAGLPEESHESLKVLHYYLDDPKVSFVAITNHILDAAKSNRAVNLFRSQTDEKDLKMLAEGCLCSNPSQPPPELQSIIAAVDKFCVAYKSIMVKEHFRKFFGLRDFIHFISYIRRHCGELTPERVLNALERNFNGLEQDNFRSIAETFLKQMNCSLPLNSLKQRNTIEVLRESLADVSLAQSRENEDIEAEVRYKLVIDTSDDDSMVRLLFKYNVLDQSSTRTFTCSSFPGDGEIQRVHVISAIKHAILEGRTVIFRQTDDINESFYDLFNQHFRRIDDAKFDGGRRYYANIAIGSHSKPCRVDPKFQCIVHLQQSEVDSAPAPFLNRFEKFLVSQDDLLQTANGALPPVIGQLMSLVMDKSKSFYEAVGQRTFYGSTMQTLQSLFLELLPPVKEKRNHFLESIVESFIYLDDSNNNEDEDEEEEEEEEDGQDEKAYYYIDETVWDQEAPTVIEHLEDVLRNKLGFHFSTRAKQERQFQCSAIFSAVLQLFDESDGNVCRHELAANPRIIQLWLAKGLHDLSRRPFLTTSMTISGHYGGAVSRDCSFAVATFVQWTVFHVCSSLLKIATPESLILQHGKIPQQYVLEYLNFQPHFALKDVILAHRDFPKAPGFASKVMCFTRTTAAIHKLPSSYSWSSTANDDSFSSQTMKKLLPGGLTCSVMMLKLESVYTLESFTNSLREFMENSFPVFLVIANMKICNQKRINHVRALIEECELTSTVNTNGTSGVKRSFVLLLHFPPSLGLSKACYPTLFLHGWEHIYLDSSFEVEQTDLVNLCNWMQLYFSEHGQCKTGISCVSELFGLFLGRLKESLKQLLPQAIDVAVARVKFGAVNDCYLNGKLDARKRAELLQELLIKFPSLAEFLCERFAKLWDLETIADQLLTAVQSQDSCLTVSECIQSRLRTLFYNYTSLSLFQLNKDYNLEILCEPCTLNDEDLAVKDLFVKMCKTLPIPQLNELWLQNHTFDARKAVGHSHQCPVFPFFSLVAQEMEQTLDRILVTMNEEVASDLNDKQMADKGEMKSEKKGVNRRDIKKKAASQLLEMLTSPVEDTTVDGLAAARLACQAIDGSKELWDRYLADFARVQWHCYLGHHRSQEHHLLKTWLDGLQGYSAKECFVELHVIARLSQKSVSTTVAALRPLESLEALYVDIKPSDISMDITESGRELEGQLYTYITNVMYGYLKNMLWVPLFVDSTSPSCTEGPLMRWCFAYQNLIASLSAMRVYRPKDVYVRSKLQAIHTIFVFVKALNFDQSAFATAAAVNLVQEICQTCDAQANSLRQISCSVQSLVLRSIVESGLSCLRQAYQFKEKELSRSDVDALFNAENAFVEDVLTFYFPVVPPGSGLFCSLPDCDWLLTMINSQHHWSVETVQQPGDRARATSQSLSKEESVSSSDDLPIGSVHFKVAQHCLMQALQSTVENDDKMGFNSEIRQRVGEALYDSSATDMESFIPVCYPKRINSCSHRPLASVYFHCCLDQLNATVNSPAFSNLLQLLNQYDEEIQSSSYPFVAVLQVECQAVTQVVIRKFSEMFEPGSVELLKPILNECAIDRVNQLFDDERWGGGKSSGHILAFLHHLSLRLRSTGKLIRIFTEEFDTFCCPFPWMLDVFNQLKEKPRRQSQLLPFMLGDSSDEIFQLTLYKQVKDLVDVVAQAALKGDTKREDVAVDELCSFCKSEACKGKEHSAHLRMMFCLAVYYQLYEKKISSQCLAEKVFVLKCIDLDEQKCCLLACFAAPKTMVCCPEPSNPINSDEVRLELHGTNVRRHVKHRDKDTADRDPLWDLFCPANIDTQDSSDVDLRRALAFLAAVVVSLPAGSTHVWTHVFRPDALEGTYVTGNLYPNVVKRDGLLYDCGCELTADGFWGRTDYEVRGQKGPLNLHSLYLLLWINFGSFCLSLLTQCDAQHAIKGAVISEWQSVRHYCLSQVKTMWMLMRNNLNFSDEERTLFVTLALHKFYEVAQRTNSPLCGTVFTNLEGLELYEKVFHKNVFQPVLQQCEDKTTTDEKIWQQHPFLMSIRRFSATYPVQPTYKDFLHSLEHIQGASCVSASEELSVLSKFVREKQRLRIGGLLLPDLVEFYVWLHQQLSHLVTMKQACELSIGDVVERLANRYSRNYAAYIQRLFARVQENYNKFVELSGGVIGQGACLQVYRQNDLQPISKKETKLAQLLSDTIEEEGGPDALFVVIKTLVTTQNDFMQAVMTADHFLAKNCTSSSSKFMLPNERKVSVLELQFHNCLMGDITPEELQQYLKREVESSSEEPGAELMKIICRHHLYVPGAGIMEEEGTPADLIASLLGRYNFKTNTMFDFHRLQQDVVTQFIAGKPFIIDPSQSRIVFHYRQEKAVQLHSVLRSSDNIDVHIDLLTLEGELPMSFKSQLSVSQKKEINIVFHNLNYSGFGDVIKALRAVAGHLSQAIMEAESSGKEALSAKCEQLAQMTIGNFLLDQVYNESAWNPELGSRIGFPCLLDDRQREAVLHTSMSELYETLSMLSSKLCDGEYEFAHLPLTLKSPLSDSAIERINNLPTAYAERGKTSAVVEHIRVFDQTLLHSEHDLEQHSKESSMAHYLVQTKFYDLDELPVCLLPEEVRVEHYMHLRLAIKRVLALQEGNAQRDDGNNYRWSDVVLSLPKEFPQLDHRSQPKSASMVSQVPFIELGGKGRLYNPLWFERPGVCSDTMSASPDDRDDEDSEFEPDDDDDAMKTAIPTLRPIVVSESNELLDTSSTIEDGDENTVKTVESSESSSSEWEEIEFVDEQLVHEASKPINIAGNRMGNKQLELLLAEAAEESRSTEATGETGTLDVSKLLENFSPDQRKSLMQQLQAEKEKDLSSMTVDDVARLLEEHGLSEYVESFKGNGIGGAMFQELDKDALKDLGVKALHCSKIMSIIKQEKKQ